MEVDEVRKDREKETVFEASDRMYLMGIVPGAQGSTSEVKGERAPYKWL
jgi:hypothetical protein